MTSFLRIIKFAVQGFFRNFWLSLVTVTMMLMAIFSVTLLFGVDYVKQKAVQGVEQKVDVLISIKPDVSREQVEQLVNSLEDLQEVRRVNIITPEENRRLFEESNIDQRAKDALKIFEEGENPFSYSLAVQAYELNQYDKILTFVLEEQFADIVESSAHRDYGAFINQIDHFAKVLNKYSWYVSLIFVLISIIVIFNTIRISIYSRRSEIQIMKLVGASNAFVRAPFVVEGIIYALVAICLVMLIVYPVVNIIQPSLNNYFQGTNVIDLAGYFRHNILQIFGAQFLALAILNIIGTSLAVRRYLKI